MKNFEILEHTADLKMKVWGKSLRELFKNAAFGMMQILSSKTKFEIKNQKSKIKIKVKSEDTTSLLIDFLNEVLYQTQVNKEIYIEVEFKTFSEQKLEAELAGVKIDKFDEDIKAVTYHEAQIAKTPEGVFETTILFDV